MARREVVQPLSSFSWKKEAKMSAAGQRLMGRTGARSARSGGHLPVWRILWYAIIVAVLLGAALAIAFTLERQGAARYHRVPGITGSARA